MRYLLPAIALLLALGSAAALNRTAGAEAILREQHGDWHLLCHRDLLTDAAECSLSAVAAAGGTKLLASFEQLRGHGGAILLLTGPDVEFDAVGGYRVDDGPATRLSTIGGRIACKVTDMPRCVVIDEEMNKKLFNSMRHGRRLRVVARAPEGMARFDYDLRKFSQAADRLRGLFRVHCGNDDWQPCAKP